jgi:uncharacterized protein YlxW (UPF0749 family)
MAIEIGALLGKIALIVSGVATVSKSVGQMSDHKQLDARVTELAKSTRELQERLADFAETFHELAAHLAGYEKETSERTVLLEARVAALQRSIYIVSGLAGLSTLYIVLHLAKLLR